MTLVGEKMFVGKTRIATITAAVIPDPFKIGSG